MARHIPRLYIDQPLSEGLELQPDDAQTHHLLTVLRCRQNDELRLFNGQGGEYTARVLETSKRHISLCVGTFISVENESPLHILLAQGIARGERMDFLIQKAVELGVQAIQPLHSEKSQRLPDDRLDKKLAHWRAVAQSATEQSGRCLLTAIHEPVAFNRWLETDNQTASASVRLLLDPRSRQTIGSQARSDQLTLLIGPESGLTDIEIRRATDQGFIAVQMGPRILRTETAGLAAIASMQTLWGDYA